VPKFKNTFKFTKVIQRKCRYFWTLCAVWIYRRRCRGV